MKIKIEVNKNKLTVLNDSWNYLAFVTYNTPEGKAMISVMNQVAEKLKKKQITWHFNPPKNKTFITLLNHEAYFFEKYLRQILPHIGFGQSYNVFLSFANELNQRLA